MELVSLPGFKSATSEQVVDAAIPHIHSKWVNRPDLASFSRSGTPRGRGPTRGGNFITNWQG